MAQTLKPRGRGFTLCGDPVLLASETMYQLRSKRAPLKVPQTMDMAGLTLPHFTGVVVFAG